MGIYCFSRPIRQRKSWSWNRPQNVTAGSTKGLAPSSRYLDHRQKAQLMDEGGSAFFWNSPWPLRAALSSRRESFGSGFLHMTEVNDWSTWSRANLREKYCHSVYAVFFLKHWLCIVIKGGLAPYSGAEPSRSGLGCPSLRKGLEVLPLKNFENCAPLISHFWLFFSMFKKTG